MSHKLEVLRKEILKIDKDFVKLLARRQSCIKLIAQEKQFLGLKIRQPLWEKAVRKNFYFLASQENLSHQEAKILWNSLINLSLKLQKRLYALEKSQSSKRDSL